MSLYINALDTRLATSRCYLKHNTATCNRTCTVVKFVYNNGSKAASQ
jgi:hypothetical protein